jgi:hypothetical protein
VNAIFASWDFSKTISAFRAGCDVPANLAVFEKLQFHAGNGDACWITKYSTKHLGLKEMKLFRYRTILPYRERIQTQQG